MSARARSRVAASPRSTTSASRRLFLIAVSPSMSPRHDPLRHGVEPSVRQPRILEDGASPLTTFVGHRAGTIQTEDGRVGRLGARGVLAGGLAELAGRSSYVEDVV